MKCSSSGGNFYCKLSSFNCVNNPPLYSIDILIWFISIDVMKPSGVREDEFFRDLPFDLQSGLFLQTDRSGLFVLL